MPDPFSPDPATDPAHSAKRRWTHALPALLLAGAMLVASGGMAFARQTQELVVPLLWRMGVEKNHAYELHNRIRKALHVPVYAVLGVLVAYGLGARQRRGLLTLLVVLVVGCADEFVQSGTPGRHASPWDVGLDVVGGALGLWLFRRWNRRGSQRT